MLDKKALLSVEHLRMWIKSNQGYVRAVDDVSFTINHGETFVLLGESGCGKSMTAMSILNLLPLGSIFGEESKINFAGKNIINYSEMQMRQLRGQRISMIFQEPMTAINPVLTIGYQLDEMIRKKEQNLHKRYEKVMDLLDLVGITDPEKRYEHYAHQLSGGMQQRVMIAMALASDPELLIADEPTTALDVTIQAQILDVLQKIQKKTGMALLLITHDLGVTQQMADNVAIMYAGHIVEQANSKTFFKQPLHPYSKQLFAAIPDYAKRKHVLSVIEGRVPSLNKPFPLCRFKNRCMHTISICEQQQPSWSSLQNEHLVRCHIYEQKSSVALKDNDFKNQKCWPIQSKPTQPILTISDFKVHYPIKKGIFLRTKGHVKAVDSVDLKLYPGKTLALVGESGCGKTTLGKAVLQLIEKSSGQLYFKNKLINNKKLIDAMRQEVQIIFQDPYASLNPRLTVEQIIEEGMRSQSLLQESTKQSIYLDNLLAQVGLPADIKYCYPHEFSGGQRQRIAIARALAVSPQILICDEPTSALDVSVQAQILNVFKSLQLEKNLAYLFITHNMSVVAYMADMIAVMYLGRIVEQGTTKEVLESPKHPYTQALLASVPMIDKISSDDKLTMASTECPSPINPPQGCHFHPRCPHVKDRCRNDYPDAFAHSDTHLSRCLLYDDVVLIDKRVSLHE